MLKSVVRVVAALSLVAAVSLSPSSADAGHVHRGPHRGLHVHKGYGHLHVHRNYIPYAGYPVYRPVVVGYYGPTYPVYPLYPVYQAYPSYPTCYK